MLLPSLSVAAVINFDDMGDANAYIFNDFNATNNDSQGALIIGGNATLNGYTVATLNDYGALALSVGGNLNMVGGDINGLSSVNGSVSVSATNDVRDTSSDFNLNQTHFTDLSTELSQSTNSTNAVKWSNLNIATTANVETYITNIDTAAFGSFTSVFTTPQALGDRIVFNIGGQSIDLNSQDWLIKTTDWDQHFSNNVLFNFYEATSLTINTSLYGSVLAPLADVTGLGGMINGQLIANSFTTGLNGNGTQLNFAPFNADKVTIDSATKVSEPSILALIIFGIGLITLRIKTHK